MNYSKRDSLIVRIQVKDDRGRVIGEVDAVSLKGLLSLAHDEELRSVRTRIVELPSAANGQRAIVRAAVRTKRGLFMATGDATPENVNHEVSGHIIRVAESRAIARAFRLAVNIGEVSVEELGARVKEGLPKALEAYKQAQAVPPPAPVMAPAAGMGDDAFKAGSAGGPDPQFSDDMVMGLPPSGPPKWLVPVLAGAALLIGVIVVVVLVI